MFLRRLGRSSARGGFSGVVYPSRPKAVAAALDTSVTEFKLTSDGDTGRGILERSVGAGDKTCGFVLERFCLKALDLERGASECAGFRVLVKILVAIVVLSSW